MVSAALDYPSQRSALQVPYGPMLLDTCVIQDLRAITAYAEDWWLTEDDETALATRFGQIRASEMVALGALMAIFDSNGAPWVVSESSLIEFEKMTGEKGRGLRRWWHDWADYFHGCLDGGWYPEIDSSALVIRRRDDVAEGQLALEITPPVHPLSVVPPLPPFKDAGDRALIRDAARAGISIILTTDLKSFWAHRRSLYPMGIEIWRPTHLWQTVCHEQAIEVARWRSMLPAA
jgi:hypothetical protein